MGDLRRWLYVAAAEQSLLKGEKAMPRSALMENLQRAMAHVAEEHHVTTTRAGLLRTAGVVGLAAVGLGRLTPAARAAAPATIVVVGAGLAGLTCAYRLKQAGYVAQVHEASDRIGGRCWTGRDFFDQGQLYEHGGELIDQVHQAIRQLAQQLGLNLDNLLSGEVNGTEPLYYFDGNPYTYAEATDDLKDIWQKLHMDVSAASYPTLFDNFTERGYELDHVDCRMDRGIRPGRHRLEARPAPGHRLQHRVRRRIERAEFTQPSLLARVRRPRPVPHVREVEREVPRPRRKRPDHGPPRRAARAADHDRVGARRCEADSGRRVHADVPAGSGTTTITADKVVLALPFSIIRRSVNVSKADFSARKLQAIAEQGMGTNSKLHVQFTRRHWNDLGCNGDTVSDTGYQSTWEVSRTQPGTAGILVDYTGGNVGASFGSGTRPAVRSSSYLRSSRCCPGSRRRWNGKATIDYWPGYEWTRGSYSYWKVGQYTTFAGIEGRQEGNAHFCGEHTSIDFQGYLNGAVETGGRVADEVINDLG